MTDPTMLAIANAVAAAIAGKSAESLSESAKRAMNTLVTKIRDRLNASPGDAAILGSAVADLDDTARQEELAEALTRISDTDDAFRDQIAGLAGSAGVHVIQADTANIVNADSVGKVVSAGRDINIGGDLSL